MHQPGHVKPINLILLKVTLGSIITFSSFCIFWPVGLFRPKFTWSSGSLIFRLFGNSIEIWAKTENVAVFGISTSYEIDSRSLVLINFNLLVQEPHFALPPLPALRQIKTVVCLALLRIIKSNGGTLCINIYNLEVLIIKRLNLWRYHRLCASASECAQQRSRNINRRFWNLTRLTWRFQEIEVLDIGSLGNSPQAILGRPRPFLTLGLGLLLQLQFISRLLGLLFILIVFGVVALKESRQLFPLLLGLRIFESSEPPFDQKLI